MVETLVFFKWMLLQENLYLDYIMMTTEKLSLNRIMYPAYDLYYILGVEPWLEFDVAISNQVS